MFIARAGSGVSRSSLATGSDSRAQELTRQLRVRPRAAASDGGRGRLLALRSEFADDAAQEPAELDGFEALTDHQ